MTGSVKYVTWTGAGLFLWLAAALVSAEQASLTLSKRERFPLRAWVGVQTLPLQLEVTSAPLNTSVCSRLVTWQ